MSLAAIAADFRRRWFFVNSMQKSTVAPNFALRALFRFVTAAGGIRLEYSPNFIPHPAEDSEFFFLSSGGMRRIVERPVVPVHLARKHWTRLIRIAADRDDGFHGLAKEFIHVLGRMARDVETDLSQRPHREGMHIARRLRAGAGRADRLARRGAQDAFG